MGKEIMIRDLTFSYGGNGNQLEHISLDIAAGEVIVMTGPSGSGKSSLTRVINGLIPYFYEGELSGEVFVDGKPLKEIPSWERGKIVGNVFQDPRSQFFANEVAGEVAFGCENYGYSHEEIRTMFTGRRQTSKFRTFWITVCTACLMECARKLRLRLRRRLTRKSMSWMNRPPIWILHLPTALQTLSAL